MSHEFTAAEPVPQEDPEWAEPLPEKIPPPSYAPAVLALGLVLILWGLIAGWMISVVGAFLTVFALSYWIRELLYG
ncbi:MAG TPA: hypothetical protein VJR29_11890 [bacterium]|nr:hypothetical protein [bacterium]